MKANKRLGKPTAPPCSLVSSPLTAQHTQSFQWGDGRHERWESVHCSSFSFAAACFLSNGSGMGCPTSCSPFGVVPPPQSCLQSLLYLSVLVFVPVCASVLTQYQLLCLLCLAFVLLWHHTSVSCSMFPSGFYFPFLNFLLWRHQELLWFHLVHGGSVLSIMGTGPSLTSSYRDHPCSP